MEPIAPTPTRTNSRTMKAGVLAGFAVASLIANAGPDTTTSPDEPPRQPTHTAGGVWGGG